MLIHSSDDGAYFLARTTWTRVTELLTEPRDTETAAEMFLEELDAEYHGGLNYPVFIFATDPVADEELAREEIEYNFTVLIEISDMTYLNDNEDYEFFPVTLVGLSTEEKVS